MDGDVHDEDVLEEKFIKGSGPGGQKINTRANRVVLRHIPTGLEVSCQDHRDLTSNRRLARKCSFFGILQDNYRISPTTLGTYNLSDHKSLLFTPSFLGLFPVGLHY